MCNTIKGIFVATYASIFVALSAYSQTRVNIGDLWYEIDKSNNTATVVPRQEGVQILDQIKNAYTQEDVIIPSQISFNDVTYDVTQIGSFAFSCSDVKHISLPPTLKSIATSAFRDAKYLEDIIIPKGVEINQGAFRDASSLSKVILPEDIEDIKNDVFRGSGLNYVALPQKVISIGTNSFYGVPLGSGAYLNEGLEEILLEAFSDANESGSMNLTEIVIPSTVNTINEHAFYNSLIKTLWFEGSPQNLKTKVNSETSFAGMYVEEIVWATEKKPLSGVTIGVKDEKVTMYYDDRLSDFKYLKPSIKVGLDPDNNVGSVSPTGIPSDILKALPPVSFSKGTINLDDYVGLCQLKDLVYESENPEIASVKGSIVTFHKAGIVTIKTSSVSESKRPLIGKERKLCIMPMTVAVDVDETGLISYKYGDMSEEVIKKYISQEATLASKKVKDENGDLWTIKYATGAEGDGLEFVYGTMIPTPAAPEEELPEITVQLHYGDEPLDMTDIDKNIAERYELLYTSSDESIVKVDGKKLLPIGVGEVSIITSAADVEFSNNGIRTITVNPRKVILKAKSVTIEDDAEDVPFVEYEIEGLAESDSADDIIKSWSWDINTIEEGVYGYVSPQLVENPLYEVEIQSNDAKLNVVRAVTRLVAEIKFDASGGTDNVLTIILSGTCRVTSGYGIISGQEGSITIPLGDVIADGQCRILTDYPERIKEIVINNAGVTGISVSDNLSSLETVDLTGNALVPGSVIISPANAGNVKLIVGPQNPVKVSVKNGNEITLDDYGNGVTVKWYNNDNVLLTEGVDFKYESGVYTFLKTLKGIYAEVSDDIITITTIPVDVEVAATDTPGTTETPGTGGGTGGFNDIGVMSGDSVVDVYTIGGVLVKRGVVFSEATRSLAPGLYIIGGKVYNVK